MNTLKANTHIEYWAHLIHPQAWELPKRHQIEWMPYPTGMFLTIEHDGVDYSLTGRSIHRVDSALARQIYRHFCKDSSLKTITIAISHKLLPETIGRGILIDAIDNNGTIALELFELFVIDSAGGVVTQPEWKVLETIEEFHDQYQAQRDNQTSSGLLMRVQTKPGHYTWFRRPLEYALTAQFTNFDKRGNLYVGWTDPVSKVNYYGFFRKGEKSCLTELLDTVVDPIGLWVDITVKSITQLSDDRAMMYGIRLEGLGLAPTDHTQQFRLV